MNMGEKNYHEILYQQWNTTIKDSNQTKTVESLFVSVFHHL